MMSVVLVLIEIQIEFISKAFAKQNWEKFGSGTASANCEWNWTFLSST